MRLLLAGVILSFVATAGSAPAADSLLREAALAYRQGDLLGALGRSSEALVLDPQNAVAKNYVWTVTQELRKKRAALRPGEVEESAVLARTYLAERRLRTEKVLSELDKTSRRSADLRSPSGLLSSLGDLGQSLGADLGAASGESRAQVYLANILGNLETALNKKVFVTRADHLRAEGYLAYYQKDWDKAVEFWEKALRESPNDVQIKNDLASLKTMLKRERERNALKDLVAQAETFQQTGLYAQAVEAWREVLRRDRNRPGAVEALAASRVSLEKTLQLKKLEAMNEEAASLYNQGKTMRAAEIWLEALQLDPTYKKARVWLKLVGRRLGRSEEEPASAVPVPVVRDPAAPAPSSASPGEVLRAEQFYKKGLVAYSEGNLEEAIRLWRQSIAADPTLKKAQEALKQGESELSLIRR